MYSGLTTAPAFDQRRRRAGARQDIGQRIVQGQVVQALWNSLGILALILRSVGSHGWTQNWERENFGVLDFTSSQDPGIL